jgi:hypothetical protein
MGKISTLGVPSAALGTGSSDSAPPSAVSRDKSVRRSAQDDVFVVSWRCKKPGQSGDKPDDICVYALRIGERPVCHPGPCHLVSDR